MSKEFEATTSAKEAAKDLGFSIADVVPSNGKKISIKDVEAHNKVLKNIDVGNAPEAPASEEPEKTPVEAPKKNPAKKGKYICMFMIKEDGNTFAVGSAYTGKNAKYLLGKKSIKKV